MPGSVYLFLGFGSGVGMDGIIHLLPFIEKSNFLIEISIYSGFFFFLASGGAQESRSLSS